MLEGCRLRGTLAVFRLLSTPQTIHDHSPCVADSSNPALVQPQPSGRLPGDEKTLKLQAGSVVMLDLTTASHDAAAFPDPETVRLDRPVESYVHYGWGPHHCLGRQASRVVLTAMFKAVVGLNNLRRAGDGNDPRGELKSMPAAPTMWLGQVGRSPDNGNGEQGASEWSGIRTYMAPDQSAYSSVPTTMRIRWSE